MKNNKAYKDKEINNINMIPGDPQGSPDESFSITRIQNNKLYKQEMIDINNLTPRYGSSQSNAGLPINSKEERVSIFIDGSNLYNNLKEYKIKIKFEDIIKKLENKRKVTGIFYYTALLNKEYNPEKYEKHQRFLEKIKKIPNFNIVLCNLRKTVLKDGAIQFDIKGDDVYLTTDLIKGAYENLYDVAIIVSGDEDFIPAIKLVQAKNKRVINAFFPKSSSYLLRNICNGSVNLKKALSEKSSPDMTES